MNIFEDRGGGKLHWKLNLYVLWVCVFFTCASYTMCVPFLPVYLLQHLGVAQADVNSWTGLIYSVTFFTAAIMAPYWGAHADRIGQRLMAIRAGFGLAVTYALMGMCQSPEQLFGVRLLAGLVSGFVPASLSLVSSTLPAVKMGWGMGLMQTARRLCKRLVRHAHVVLYRSGGAVCCNHYGYCLCARCGARKG